jgi:hypothetical protein
MGDGWVMEIARSKASIAALVGRSIHREYTSKTIFTLV